MITSSPLGPTLETARLILRPTVRADFEDLCAFHADPETQMQTVLTVRSAEIGEPPYPNWTVVGVNWLAGFDFEIKVIARISSE